VIVALGFVASVVPVRDRCWDPQSAASTRVTISREEGGAGSCVLHVQTGDVRIGAAQCALLRCEPGLASTLVHARLGVLGPLLLFYGLGSIAWAARWRALLRFAGVDLPLARVWRVSVEAQAGGILLPGGIGGDALRIASVVGSRQAKIAIVVASVLLDRAVGLAVVAGMAATLAFAWGGLEAGPLPSILAMVPVAFFACFAVLRRAPLERVQWLVAGRIGGIARPVLEYVRDSRAPRAIAVAALLSIVVAGVQFATIRGLIFALGAAPTAEKWVYLGTAMVFVVSAIPALPGAWGTADAAYIFFFGLAGLPAGTSLAVCLLYRLFWYISGVVGAIMHVARLPVNAWAVDRHALKRDEPPA
jgi:uncharacterized protein (TIRG00374 family)